MTEPIAGYRELSQQEVDEINAVKEIGAALKEAIANLRLQQELDQHFVSIGETHLQLGIMALVRSIAQPESF